MMLNIIVFEREIQLPKAIVARRMGYVIPAAAYTRGDDYRLLELANMWSTWSDYVTPIHTLRINLKPNC